MLIDAFDPVWIWAVLLSWFWVATQLSRFWTRGSADSAFLCHSLQCVADPADSMEMQLAKAQLKDLSAQITQLSQFMAQLLHFNSFCPFRWIYDV